MGHGVENPTSKTQCAHVPIKTWKESHKRRERPHKIWKKRLEQLFTWHSQRDCQGMRRGKQSQLDYRKKKSERERERERESSECRGDEWLKNLSRKWILRLGLSLTLWPSYQAFPELFWQLFHMLPVYFHPNTGQCHVSIISGDMMLTSLCECVCDGSYHWSCYTWTSLSLPTSCRHRCRIPCLPGSCYEVLISFTVCGCGQGYVLNVVALYITVLVGERKKRTLGFMDESDSVTTDAIPQCTFLLAWGICHCEQSTKKQKDGQAPWQYHGMIRGHIKTIY